MSMQKGAISAKKNSGSDDVVNSSVFKLAWPIFVQALLSMLLGYIDTLMLSGYDQTAVGAIGNANQILGFLTLAFTIISSASGVVVAQYLGAGKKDKINQIYTVCVAFNLALSLIVSGIVYVGSDGLMKLLNTPEAMMPDARSYMRIVGGFIFTQAVLDTMSRIFQSNGRTEFGMIISLGMNILNVCGNYLFLYGPLKSLGLGASGVAVSTTFSRIAGLCAAFVFFSAFIDGHISVKYLRPFPKDILKTLLRLGIPTAGENISYNISQLFVTGFVNTLGIAAINTKIYANILISFAYLYSVSVAMATTIIVGHAVGAGDYDFAYKRVNKTMRSALIVSVCIACINFLISPVTLGLFTRNSATPEMGAQIVALGRSIFFVAIFLEFGRQSRDHQQPEGFGRCQIPHLSGHCRHVELYCRRRIYSRHSLWIRSCRNMDSNGGGRNHSRHCCRNTLEARHMARQKSRSGKRLNSQQPTLSLRNRFPSNFPVS